MTRPGVIASVLSPTWPTTAIEHGLRVCRASKPRPSSRFVIVPLTRHRHALVILALFLVCGIAQSQQISLEPGITPYGTHEGGDVDTVNVGSGAVHIHIPLVSYPQRGKELSLSFSIMGDTLPYYAHYILPNDGGWQTPSPGTNELALIEDQSPTYSKVVQGSCQKGDQVQTNYFQTAAGYVYVLGEGGQCGTAAKFITSDGSGYIVNLPGGSNPPQAIDRKGITYYLSSGNLYREDTNGNQISGNFYHGSTLGYIDTLGRSIPAPTATTNYSGCTGPLPIVSAKVWNIPGPSGGTSTFKFCYATVTFHTAFNVAYVSEASGSGPLLQSVVLPNNQAWTFQYGDQYSNVTQITLPTGGWIQYSYQNYTVPNCSPSNQCPTPATRRLASRTVNANDGTGNHTWTYQYVLNAIGPSETVTVKDSLLNQTVYAFFDDLSSGWRETQRQVYQSSSPLLETVQTMWGDPYGNTCYTTGHPLGPCFPTKVTTIWPNGKQKQVQKDYGSSGQVLAEREYDYGLNAPGSLLRTTTTAYLSLNNSSYAASNLLDLPSQVSVFAGTSASGACGVNGAIACMSYGYDEMALGSSGITTQHDSAPPAGTYRGNQTSINQWLNTNNTSLSSSKIFYDTGTVETVTDPGTNTTTYTYDSTFAGAYATKMQLPDTNSPNLAHHITQDWYDFNTGLKTSHTDENSNPTTYTYDGMGRLKTIVPPAPEGSVTLTYTDTPGSLSVEKQQAINVTQSTNAYTLFDGLGRQISQIVANGQTTPYDRTDICYDARGLKSFTSYPYQTNTWSTWSVCPSSQPGDSYAYDSLMRPTTLTHSDSTLISNSYTGAASSVTDEGNGTRGVQKISQVDGLGRLISVCEVTTATLAVGTDHTPAPCNQDISGTGFLTTYTYDGLSNLTSVSQGSSLNQRTFTYDSLSRLITTTNPETGTTCFGTWVSGSCVENYDANSNILSRTRPAPNQSSSTTYVTTSFSYDSLNRLRAKTYSDGTTPSVTLDYDETTVSGNSLSNTTGRMSSEYTGPSSAMTSQSILSYAAPGWIATDIQCTPQNCGHRTFSFSYGYDGIGDVTGSGNGNGITYTLSYSAAPRLTQIATNWISSTISTGNLITSIQYNASAEPASASLYNSINETWSYDVRGRIQSYSAKVSSATRYGLTNVTYSGNSNILSVADTVNGTWSSYAYDDFNHLVSSSCTANCPQGQSTLSFSYTYDRYGNRWWQNVTVGGGTWNQPSYNFDANNRIATGSGFTYDAAGNITNDSIHSYAYDAENRIVKVDAGTAGVYSYDAEGRRVANTVGSTSYEYLFDLDGRAVTELVAGTATTNRTEVYAGGRHLATQNVTLGTTYFIHTDWLGTERARTNLGNTVVETCTSLPYGDNLSCTGADISPLHFTGKMRDIETGLDEFPARYYSSTQGRWYSPDWASAQIPVPYADLHNPQTLNLYSYVGDDPTNHPDADGHAQTADNSAFRTDEDFWERNDESDGWGGGTIRYASRWTDRNDKTYTIQVVGSDGKRHEVHLPVGSQVVIMTRQKDIRDEEGKAPVEAVTVYRVYTVTATGLEGQVNTEVRMKETIKSGSNCSAGCSNKDEAGNYDYAQFVDHNSVQFGYSQDFTQQYFIGKSDAPATILRQISGIAGVYDMGTRTHVIESRSDVTIRLE
jgi:RHS repeat-associated protein